MKIAYAWLRELLPDLQLSPGDLAARLTLAGLEVESVHDPAAHWAGVVVGHVLKAEPHPNANKLRVCEVDVGGGAPLSIVCGAANVAAGQKVPVALEGAVLPGAKAIGRAVLRGVESRGMICSERELGLAARSEGILVLSGENAKAPPGAEISKVLSTGALLDVAITPNRGDCLSALGLAREVAALSDLKLAEPRFSLAEKGEPIGPIAGVAVEASDLCPRYCARVIEGVSIRPSPDWLQDRLEEHGIRAINNVVDITNYILLLHGQPLHAFDLDRLAEPKITVRRCGSGEEIETLDGKKRALPEGALAICDTLGPVAVAGVMGGARSEVRPGTKRIFLESAYFEPAQVRRVSRQLGLSSESSYRFERGVDPARVPVALDHAAALLAELAGGKVCKGVLDVAARRFASSRLNLRPAKVQQLLGLALSERRIKDLLESLGCSVSGAGERLAVDVPTWRPDLTHEADLIEELVRLEGYDKIPETLPAPRGGAAEAGFSQRRSDRIEDTLAARGWRQGVHLSFIEESWADWLALPARDVRRRAVRISNPLSEEQRVLRSALLPSLLSTYARNRNRGVREAALFEQGRVFTTAAQVCGRSPDAPEAARLAQERSGRSRGGELPFESLHLALLAGAQDDPTFWRPDDGGRSALFDLKSDLLAVGAALGVALDLDGPAEEPFLHPGRRGSCRIGDKTVGFWGELAPSAAERYGIRERVVAAELSADALLEAAGEARRSYEPIGKFPAIWRDLALVVPEEIPARSLLDAALSAGAPLAAGGEIFDEFRGKAIEPGKRSLGIRLCYSATDRTLTEEEAEGVQARVLAELSKRFGAQRRG